MTKKQREQVVERLRCATDNISRHRAMPFSTAGDALGGASDIISLAKEAWNATRRTDVEATEEWQARHLEAAQLVEEGSWP